METRPNLEMKTNIKTVRIDSLYLGKYVETKKPVVEYRTLIIYNDESTELLPLISSVTLPEYYRKYKDYMDHMTKSNVELWIGLHNENQNESENNSLFSNMSSFWNRNKALIIATGAGAIAAIGLSKKGVI